MSNDSILFLLNKRLKYQALFIFYTDFSTLEATRNKQRAILPKIQENYFTNIVHMAHPKIKIPFELVIDGRE
jgi:hypothetical protein